MTFRTVVRDGLIVINTHGELPDGTPVEVVRTRSGHKSVSAPRRQVKKTKAPAKKKPIRELAFFGMWKDRPEWKGKTTLEIQKELREKALGRSRRV
jgi:hypothetical protein